MNKQTLIAYWEKFFRDLFVGSLIRLICYTGFGCCVGILSTFLFNLTSLNFLETSDWIKWISFGLVFIWNISFGFLHSFFLATIQIITQKLSEVTLGLQALLDLLSKEVLTKIKTLNKSYQKEDAARIFSQMGDNFLKNLELRGGLQGLLGSLFFGFIIKVLRFLFLKEIADRLLSIPGTEAATSDIESAVRHVGINKILEPIGDNLALAQFANFIFFLLSFGFPFFVLWFFT